jgi:hypothetical protein
MKITVKDDCLVGKISKHLQAVYVPRFSQIRLMKGSTLLKTDDVPKGYTASEFLSYCQRIESQISSQN